MLKSFSIMSGVFLLSGLTESVEVTDWVHLTQMVTFIVAAAGLLFGLWRYIIIPLYRVYAKIRNSSSVLSGHLPTLLKIAEDFPSTENDPSTLKTELTSVQHEIEFLMWYQEILSKELLGGFNSICFFECDESGRVVFMSKAWASLTGKSVADALGWGWTNSINPPEREKILIEWEKNIQFQENFQLDFKLTDNTKTNIPVRCRVFVLKRTGNKLYVIGNIAEHLTP